MRLEKPKHSPEIAIAKWHFALGPLNEAVAATAHEVISDALLGDEDGGLEAALPNYWNDSDGNGGPPVPDPLTIYIYLPFAEHATDDQPFWALSLDALIEDEINSATEDDGSMEDGTRAFAARVRDRLRVIADRIEDQISKAARYDALTSS